MKPAKKFEEKRLPIQPCGHYVLVKPDPVETTTASGIITGTEHQHKREHVASVKGTLVGIGENAWVAFGGEPWATLNAHVYFKRHVSDRVEDIHDLVDGKPQEYFLMADENILAVIED